MNIVSIKNNIIFKSNEPIGFDDEISKQRREYIRCHYDSWHTPTADIYSKEPRLDEYSLKKLVGTMKMKPQMVDKYLLPDDYGIKKIDYDRKTNSYRGQTLVDAPINALQNLKKAGIKTVIDLAGYGNRYKAKVEEAGMQFFSYNIANNDYDYVNLNKDWKDKFIGFIKKMQEDYVYIACEYGSYKTDDALILNSFFNPKANRHSTVMRYPGQHKFIKKIYSVLTKEDFAKLSWTKEFDKKFFEMLKKASDNKFFINYF